MRQFFYGWRRKVGCIMLVVACGLMGLWIRTFHDPDYLTFSRDSRHFGIYLTKGTVVWSEFTPDRCGPVDLWSREFHYSRYVVPLTLLSAYLILWGRPVASTIDATRHVAANGNPKID